MILIKYHNGYYHLGEEMRTWCYKTFGTGIWYTGKQNDFMNSECSWLFDTAFGQSSFIFKNEKDAAWFLLNWPGGHSVEDDSISKML